MPISKYFKGHGAEVMSNMKKQYGAKKGKSVFYATANKKGLTGSGPFSAKEQEQGFKVLCDANDLNKMDVDRVENVPEEYRLAKRREANVGGHATRKTFRRSESTKGSY